MAPYALVSELLNGTKRFLPTAPTKRPPPMVTQRSLDGPPSFARTRQTFARTKGVYTSGIEARLPAVNVGQIDSPAPGLYYYMHSGNRPPTTYQYTRNCSNMIGPQVDSGRRSAPSFTFGELSIPSNLNTNQTITRSNRDCAEGSLFDRILTASQPPPGPTTFHRTKIPQQIVPKSQVSPTTSPKLPKLSRSFSWSSKT